MFVEEFGFQLVNAIVTQLFNQFKSEMGQPNNISIDKLVQPNDTFPPKTEDVIVINATQDNTTSVLVESMMISMDIMRLRFEKSESWG